MTALARRDWPPSATEDFVQTRAGAAAALAPAAVADRIEALAAENRRIHERECFNLNPATNVLNPRAEAILAAGIGSRPSLGYPGDKYEMGLEAIEEIEVIAAELAAEADMIIGAVLIPGAAAPKLISRAQLSDLKPGAALVDVAIDQGGCFETSRATTHQDPIYDVDGIMHYCVANMPGAVARTSTIALGNATLPYMLALADKGWRQACEDDPHLLNGLNVHAGKLTYFAVGKALGIDVLSPALALKA